MEKYNFGDSAVIVARVSTPYQTKSPQLADLRAYAEGLGYKHIKEFGTTESGFLEMDDKQGWNLVTQFFEANPEYKVLICTELSRLSRVKSMLMLIEEYLIKNKIQLIVKDINFWLFNEYGSVTTGADMIFTLYASFAASEMSNKKERIKRALKEYREKGYSIGGKRLFGYDRQYVKYDEGTKPKSIYVINKKEKEELLQVYRWYVHGIDNDLSKTSIRTITEKCIEEGMSKYLHSQRNVNKCLKEQAYTGLKQTHNMRKNPEYWNYHHYDKPKYITSESYDCRYPLIFEGDDKYLFDYAQERLRENNSKLSKKVPVLKEHKHTTILSKLLVCPQCGRYLNGEYRVREGKKHFVYRCAYSRAAVDKCSFTHTLSMQMLDSIVWQYCYGVVRSIRVSEIQASVEKEAKDVQQKIKNLQLKIDALKIRYTTEETVFRSNMKRAGTNDDIEKIRLEYERKVAFIDKDRKNLEKRQGELMKDLQSSRKNIDVTEEIRSVHDINKRYRKEEIAKYMHQIVKSINIVYTDTNYTVLQIHTSSYLGSGYICIFKRRTLFIEAVSLYHLVLKPGLAKGDDKCPVLWDCERNLFVQGKRTMTLQDVYDFAFKGIDNIQMMIFTNRIPFKKLDCYDEDM